MDIALLWCGTVCCCGTYDVSIASKVYYEQYAFHGAVYCLPCRPCMAMHVH